MRMYWRADLTSTSADPIDQGRVQVPREQANLVGSNISPDRRLHMPVIDLDIPARLVPSTTPGHSHLYIDRVITWPQYKRVLKALYKAGLIERGFYKLSVARRATFARLYPKGVREQ